MMMITTHSKQTLQQLNISSTTWIQGTWGVTNGTTQTSYTSLQQMILYYL
jgi:hypothetical protein